MSAPRPPIRLRIDRLVLEGVAPQHRQAVQAAFEGELARLLAAGPRPSGAARQDSLAVPAASGRDPAATGRAAAAALHRAVSGRAGGGS